MIPNAGTADDSLNTQSRGDALSARRPRPLRFILPVGTFPRNVRESCERAVGASLPVVCKESTP